MINEHPARPEIVVGVDGSESALHATRWAAREAESRNLPLRLVHVCEPPVISHPTTMAGQGTYLGALRDQGRHWVREAVAAAGSVAPTVPVAEVVRVGGAAAVMVEESLGARLTVLGSRGLGGLPDMTAGSVAVAVAEHGHTPVVVVRGRTLEDPPPAGGPVLVGVDGSPASEAAVEFAFDLASFRGTELVALHSWSEVSFDTVWTMLAFESDWHAVADEEHRLLNERMAGWQEKYPDVPVHRVVVRDQPVRALLKAAERTGAQLIVLGTRGLGGDLTGMGMGSTSRALLYQSECPVAVVRPNLKGDNR
jgi:nucleotide-binding universal stress UspA family protein